MTRHFLPFAFSVYEKELNSCKYWGKQETLHVFLLMGFYSLQQLRGYIWARQSSHQSNCFQSKVYRLFFFTWIPSPCCFINMIFPNLISITQDIVHRLAFGRRISMKSNKGDLKLPALLMMGGALYSMHFGASSMIWPMTWGKESGCSV